MALFGEDMIHKYKTLDCPDANNRTPESGEQKYTLNFSLESGDDYLEIEMGKKGRDSILRMLTQEKLDQLCASCGHLLARHTAQEGMCLDCNCVGWVDENN